MSLSLKFLTADALFFKFRFLLWNILGAISLSTCFAACYSGSLDRLLSRIQLDHASAEYCRRVSVIYTSIAWVMFLLNAVFVMYSFIFTGGYMDITLTPVTIYVSLSDLLIPRIALYLFSFHHAAAWIFPHAMSFMLATIFTRQYKMLSKRMLAESDERQLSDSDIASLNCSDYWIVDCWIRISKFSDSVITIFQCPSVTLMIS